MSIKRASKPTLAVENQIVETLTKEHSQGIKEIAQQVGHSYIKTRRVLQRLVESNVAQQVKDETSGKRGRPAYTFKLKDQEAVLSAAE